jgi:hypothetical protein
LVGHRPKTVYRSVHRTGTLHSARTFCLQDDHPSAHCPHNLNHPYFGWLPDPAAWPAFTPPTPLPQTRPPTHEICRRFNEGRCKHQRCKYRHACNDTHATYARGHMWLWIAPLALKARGPSGATLCYELQTGAHQTTQLDATRAPTMQQLQTPNSQLYDYPYIKPDHPHA